MSLEEALKKAVGRIRSGALENEAQVKQAVILPILRELDWDDSEPDEFVPELSVNEGFVDYALLHAGASQVFIEAKRPGGLDVRAEDQLFRYAVNKGVPFLILTDGDIWDFYLAMAAGVPADRRFYRAELTRGERISEYVDVFEKHLRKSRVVSGKARQAAERRHESNKDREKARRAIPGVWRKLLETPDEMLRDLLAEEVASACGTRPEADDVERFLKELADSGVTQTQKPPASASETSAGKAEKRPRSEPPPQDDGKSKIRGFILDGERFDTKTAIEALTGILKAFADRDSKFMARFAPQVEGKRKTADGAPKRRLVARNRNDLYANPELAQNASSNLGNGWWLATNNNTALKRKYIQTACEVADVKFGSQLRLIEG